MLLSRDASCEFDVRLNVRLQTDPKVCHQPKVLDSAATVANDAVLFPTSMGCVPYRAVGYLLAHDRIEECFYQTVTDAQISVQSNLTGNVMAQQASANAALRCLSGGEVSMLLGCNLKQAGGCWLWGDHVPQMHHKM